MKTVVYILLFLFFFFLIAISPGAFNWHGDIEPENFKCVKFKTLKKKHPRYCKFLEKFHPFCVFWSEKGAIIPLPILYICFSGYLFFLIAIVFEVVLLILIKNVFVCFRALLFFYLIETGIVVTAAFILFAISKHRENLKYK